MADETIELTEVQEIIGGLSSPSDEEFVQATRAYSDGAVAGAAALIALEGGGGGGSLPDWWEVVSTPGAESVEMGGKIVLDPASGADGDVPILLMEGNAADMVDTSNNGIFFGGRMAGGSQSWDDDFVYRFGVLEMMFKSPPDEGAASFYVMAADTTGAGRLSDGRLVLYEDFNGDPSITAELAPRYFSLYTGQAMEADNAGSVRMTYDDDNATPALVFSAKTADGSQATATIPLTPL